MVMIANIFNEQLQLPAMEELYFQKARSAVYAPLQLPVLTFAEKAMSTTKIEVEVETPRARIEGHFMNIESAINVEIEEEKIDSEDLEPEVQYTKLHEFEFDADELCAICYCGELGEEDQVQLGCGHVFHTGCVEQLLKHKWSTLKISFAFMSCPSCKAEIEETSCQEINDEIKKLQILRHSIEKQALEVAENQGLDKHERLTTPGDFYEGKLLEFALHSCAFYACYECEKPYFGGMVDCQAQLGIEEKANKEDLRCKDCTLKAYGAGKETCEKHGDEHIDWKCMFCCSVAVWHCFGTHFFCERCHNEYC